MYYFLMFMKCSKPKEGLKVAKFHCGTILYPIEVMEDEHNHEGERFEKNSSLTNGFTHLKMLIFSFFAWFYNN